MGLPRFRAHAKRLRRQSNSDAKRSVGAVAQGSGGGAEQFERDVLRAVAAIEAYERGEEPTPIVQGAPNRYWTKVLVEAGVRVGVRNIKQDVDDRAHEIQAIQAITKEPQ